jgi:cytidyltransferase-like protein
MKKVIVLVGGTFNLVHQGHIFFLNRAKELGNYLVVVIATDKTVMKNKGVLLLPAEKRRQIIEKLGIADRVVVGSDSDFFKTVNNERPDIIALGYDQELKKELIKKIKKSFPDCRIVRIDSKLKGYSTSKILRELGIKKTKKEK